ncbi:hypothetical protein V3C99_008993 [Haemonchus contortus]
MLLKVADVAELFVQPRHQKSRASVDIYQHESFANAQQTCIYSLTYTLGFSQLNYIIIPLDIVARSST